MRRYNVYHRDTGEFIGTYTDEELDSIDFQYDLVLIIPVHTVSLA